MKRIGFRGYMIIAIAILVIAVAGLYFFNMNRVTPTATKKAQGVQITQSAPGQYQTVIKDGRYLVSAARGITASSEPNNLDVKHFESGLLDLAKTKFKPSQYILRIRCPILLFLILVLGIHRHSNDHPSQFQIIAFF